jgi:hypothetical protein
MTQPNMKKEYRTELRSVRKQLGRLTRETRAARKQRDRELKEIFHARNREMAATRRDFDKLFRRHERAGQRLVKRQQILEGRLS